MIINKIDNTAYLTYKGKLYPSNTVSTIIDIAPIISMSVDKEEAESGELLNYIVTLENHSLKEVSDIPFTVLIPEGTTYEVDSFMFDGIYLLPEIEGNNLNYNIPSISSNISISISYKVRVNEQY